MHQKTPLLCPKTALSADLDACIKMYHTEYQYKDDFYSSELHIYKYEDKYRFMNINFGINKGKSDFNNLNFWFNNHNHKISFTFVVCSKKML